MLVPTTQEDFMYAIKTMLGGLPKNTELRFYWGDDNRSHFDLIKSDGTIDSYALNRQPDGTGRIVPGALHS